MYSFTVWITVLTPSYTDAIIAAIVRKGYTVSATAGKGEVFIAPKEQDASAIISLKISIADETKQACNIYEDISLVLKEIKAFYYSIVVCKYVADSIWCGTNINISIKRDPLPDEKDYQI